VAHVSLYNRPVVQTGLIVDISVVGLQVPVRDDRFLAVNTLRLIGYLLNSTGSPCRALWAHGAQKIL
jgi:hypothetical protein